MEIKYDVPFEVNEKQYNRLKVQCAGILCHREDQGKFYIKVWLMKYTKLVKQILKEEEN